MADGKGLSLLIQTTGAKWWRFRYRFDDKAKMLSLDVYPDVGLKDARDHRGAARKLVADDIDPGVNRKAVKSAKTERAANSLEVVAREWYAKNLPTWAATHSNKIIRRFEMYVFPWLGGRPVAEITAPELLKTVTFYRATCLRHVARSDAANLLNGDQNDPQPSLKPVLNS